MCVHCTMQDQSHPMAWHLRSQSLHKYTPRNQSLFIPQYLNIYHCKWSCSCSLKPWSQPTVRVFSPYVFLGGHVRYVFLKTLGGSGKSREGVRHTQGVSTWPARHAGRERLRASYVAHVVSELYVLTTCLQRTISL